MKFKEIISYVFAEKEDLSLEHRFFLSSIIIGTLTSIVGSLINFFIATSYIAGIIPFFLTVLLVVLYYFIRFKKLIKPFVVPMIIISMLGISVIWIFNGGINGSNSLTALVILTLALVVVPDKLKKYIFTLFVSLNIVLYLIQLYRPDLITNFPNETERWIDSLITLTYVSYFIFLIIEFLHKNYRLERKKAEESEKNILNQNVEIELNNSRLESLLKISQLRTDSTQQLLDFALNEAIKITNSKFGYIYFYNENTKQFVLNSWSKDVMKECSVQNPQTIYDLEKTGVWGEAVRQRKPIVLNDYQAENQLKKGIPEGHVKLTKFLTIPVIFDEKIVAVAGVANKEIDYNNSDIRQLTLLMDNVWKISERLILIEFLKTSNSKLNLAMQVANMAWWEMDIETGNVTFDKRKTDMLGYSSEMFTHYKDFIELLHPEDYDKAMNAIHNHINGTTNKYELEYRIKTKSGEYKWFFDVGTISQRNSNETPKNITGLVIDITQRKLDEEEQNNLLLQIQETKEIIESNLFQKNVLIEEISETKHELEKLNSEKDKFFSIIAHDLLSPFNGFLGLTKMMADNTSDFTLRELQEISKSMQTSANNLFSLLKNLLEWSRMQRGMTDFKKEQLEMKFIAEQIFEVQTESAKQKGIEFINCVPADVFILADKQMINTIVRNLVSNALKFTNQGGKIEIGLVESSTAITEIYVKDNGIGMNDFTLNNLFNLVENVSRPGTKGELSSGLGLILCKEFVEKHGGEIWAESEEGKGSTFYFTIPLNKI